MRLLCLEPQAIPACAEFDYDYAGYGLGVATNADSAYKCRQYCLKKSDCGGWVYGYKQGESLCVFLEG